MFKDHTWSDSIIQSLPSLHAISGCDAVSAFHDIEKATWLSTIQKKEEYLDIWSICVICMVCRWNTELIALNLKYFFGF